MTTVAPPRPGSRSGDRKRVDLWTDVPFTKAAVSSTGDIELRGYASTWGLDRDEELVAPNAFEKSLSAYLAKNPIVLWQHNSDWPIGQVSSGHTDDTGLYVVASIPNPGDGAADWQKGAYTAIKNGIVRTFSIGGYMTRDVKPGPDGPVFYIVEVELFEISCVSIPANADSIYEAAMKALRGDRPRLHEKAVAQMEQLLGFKLVSDPELVAMDAEAREERYGQLSAMFERAYGVEAPPMDSWARIDAAIKAGADPLAAARATSLVAKAFYSPAPPEADEKAGRAISAANKTKLQSAIDAHEDIEKHMVDAAESMKAAAKSHADAVSAIKDVIGVGDDPDDDDAEPDEDEREDAPPNSPEKGATPEAPVQVDPGPRQDTRKAREAEAEEEEAIGSSEDEDLMLANADYTKDLIAAAIYHKNTGLETKGALSLANLPIADRDRAWDAGAAKRRVHAWAERGGDQGGYDPAKMSKAYLWRDNGADPSQASGYRFIVADIVDGALTYIPRGIFAAAGVVQGGRGGTADEIASAIKPAIEKLYSRMASKFDDSSIVAPWKAD